MVRNNNGGIDINSPLFEGLYKKNTVLVSGLVVAPVVFSANTLSKAIVIMFAFSIITLLTVMLSSLISRNIVYTIRIILYTLIASIVYVPVMSICLQIFPQQVEQVGVMLPLLITNALIVSKTELRFFRRTKGKMLVDLISFIIGFDIVVLIIGFLREVLGTGTLFGKMIGIPFTFPALVYPFGGFIFLGLLAAGFRKIQYFLAE